MAGLGGIIFNTDRNSSIGSPTTVPFLCSYCGVHTDGPVLASRYESVNGFHLWPKWLLCTRCGEGSVVDTRQDMHPAPKPGPAIDHLPEDVAAAYEEARKCLGVGAYTACELVCRNILMHIAVDVAGAKEGDTFTAYLQVLVDGGWVTPAMRPWVEQIKERGNGANHDLPQIGRDRAASTFTLTFRLLEAVYENQALADQFTRADPGS